MNSFGQQSRAILLAKNRMKQGYKFLLLKTYCCFNATHNSFDSFHPPIFDPAPTGFFSSRNVPCRASRCCRARNTNCSGGWFPWCFSWREILALPKTQRTQGLSFFSQVIAHGCWVCLVWFGWLGLAGYVWFGKFCYIRVVWFGLGFGLAYFGVSGIPLIYFGWVG